MLRRLNPTRWTPVLAVVALVGCDLITGADSYGDARVEVDPTVVRTIHYYPPGPNLPEPPPEVTTKGLDEIACLRTRPGCWISEMVTATVYNTGTRPLYWNDCHQPLQRFGLGEWHWVTLYPCALPGLSVRPFIAPGEHRDFPVGVQGAPAGLYRVALQLWDGEGGPRGGSGTSAPFALQPLPDVPPFVCPTENRAELSERIAREALEAAATGRPTPDVREMLLLENQVPGFGGLFLENGFLTVWLQDLSRSEAMVAAVRAMYGRTPVIKKGVYSFSELVGWKESIYDGFNILGVQSVDADEGSNRLTIGITNELIRADVECFVRGIGMPEGMALIER